ncbi:MAG TPA: hypothetical protein VF584_25885 [Longimicrobium sp.]|jgi:hypothetical protein
MIPRDEIEAFWEVTQDCLIQFHGLSPADAAARVTALREDLDAIDLPGEPMIYHDEPFNVACGLARRELNRFEPEVAEEYYRMLNRPFPVVDEADALAVHETPAEYRVAR